MTDIVTRLRNWRTVHLARLHLLMEEAADEMERLRADWPEQPTAHKVLITEQELEIARLRLRLSRMADCPEPENAVSDDIAVRKTGGDFGRPVAWVVALGGDGLIIDGIFLREKQAEEACAWRNEHTSYGARIIPLYEKPQTCPHVVGHTTLHCSLTLLTITDEEREAIAWCVEMAATTATECDEELAALRGLLERTK
jgi:hypothetical protein